MDLPDDTYLGEPEADVKAAAMREILGRDLEEAQIAQLVVNFDLGDFEMQQAAWLHLAWKERHAWQQYRNMAAELARYGQVFTGRG